MALENGHKKTATQITLIHALGLSTDAKDDIDRERCTGSSERDPCAKKPSRENFGLELIDIIGFGGRSFSVWENPPKRQ